MSVLRFVWVEAKNEWFDGFVNAVVLFWREYLSMSLEDQFNVYITGEAIDGYDLASAQESFAAKFKLATEKMDRVFQSPMPFTIKKGIDSKSANAYLKAIHSMGLDAHIEAVPALKVSVDTMTLVSQEDHQKHLDAAPQVTASKSYDSVVEAKETSGVALEVLYDAPDSALSEEDGQVRLGGWLRFFQVINVLSLAFATLLFFAGVILTVMEGFDQKGLIEVLVSLIESLPVIVFCVLILRMLSDRSEDVPRRISIYLNFKFLATIGVFWILTVFHYSEIEQPKEIALGRNIGMVLTMLYCWIWMFYFKRSKRVKEYYNLDVNYQKKVSNDQANEGGLSTYSNPESDMSSMDKEREFKVPLVALISPVVMILIYVGYVVVSSTGNEGLFDSLKPISFNVFLLCELALLFLIVYSKKQLDGFLKLHPVIRDREALLMLKPVLMNNSHAAMTLMFFLVLGAITSIVTIANAKDFEGAVVSGLCLLAMGFMAWYNPSEQKVKQLKCTDESLEEELIAILGKWGNKAVSKS